MNEEELKQFMFSRAMRNLKEWHHHGEDILYEGIYRKWYEECSGCVPEEFADEHLENRIADKFYVMLDAVKQALVREGLVKDSEIRITIWPSREDTTFCVMHWRKIVLLDLQEKARHLKGVTSEEFKEYLLDYYKTAKHQILAYKGLENALKELQMARCNAENCEEHKEEAEGLTELEHVDIHIDGALIALERFLKE